MKRLFIGLAFASLFLGTAAIAASPQVYIVSPEDGAKLKSPVTVVFGLDGYGVAPAGVERDSTGHHHLIVDAPLPDLTKPIPADNNYLHFGGGQTQTSLNLPPGTHTLQLLLGDHLHIPHIPPIYSDVVTITVE